MGTLILAAIAAILGYHAFRWLQLPEVKCFLGLHDKASLGVGWHAEWGQCHTWKCIRPNCKTIKSERLTND